MEIDVEIERISNGFIVTGKDSSESWTDKQTGQKQERTEWH